MDYTDLNKACPADPFALPRIDQIIDATVGCERLSFLDAYSSYHQIKMCLCLLALRVPGDLPSMCTELSP